MVKKAIILQHNGDEMGSQLWNFASIYAYCLERGIPCHNYSFFEYAEYFPHIRPHNILIRWIFYKAFYKARGRKNSLYTRFFRFFYKLYVAFIRITQSASLIRIGHTVKYKVLQLPPTGESKEINRLEKRKVMYFDGHLFRNTKGLEKYRAPIIKHLTPSVSIQKAVGKRLHAIRKQYPHLIGVHIRGGDYITFKRGRFFVDQGHMRAILDEFIAYFKIPQKKTFFYITSDSPLEEHFFEGLNFSIESDNPAIEMYTLAGTDIIIGSDSNFGSFASYYGNIPHIVCDRNSIDWNYYRDKQEFFYNRYWRATKY